MNTVLRTESLTKSFGNLVAVNNLNITFGDEEHHAIIGPNGAGKTTLFNLLTGVLSPTSGRIFLENEDITKDKPHQIAERGLIRTFQVTNVFSGLSLFDNVRISVQPHTTISPYNFWSRAKDQSQVNEQAREALNRTGLHNHDQTARNLSHGERRMLEMAIVLATDPEILLLDEPTSGMSSEDTQDMIELIEDLPETLPVILIEHKMSVVHEVADRVSVLHQGDLLATGDPDEVREDEQVQKVYLEGV